MMAGSIRDPAEQGIQWKEKKENNQTSVDGRGREKKRFRSDWGSKERTKVTAWADYGLTITHQLPKPKRGEEGGEGLIR